MGVAFQIKDLVKEYGGRRVLDRACATIQDDTKIGVIGRNGAGKSTLCRILLGLEEAESGQIIAGDGLRIGYLEQHDAFTLEETAQAYLERRTERPEWRCAELAGRLGLRGEALASPIGALPGGWRTRVKLTAMLLEEPDFLILDEPTNFLDLATVLLLQEFLGSFRGGMLLVSHDREFLKDTCDHTLSVERGGLTLFPGDVEAFFVWEAEQMEVARRTNEAIEAKREHLQAFVDRFRAKASKATQAQSKMKEIERLRPVVIANPLATVRISIPPVPPRRGAAFGTEGAAIGYPGKTIATDVRIHVDRGARVAIVGDNGQGKTTLLRTLAGDLEPVTGTVWRAPGLEVSVYAQHVYQSLHPADTVRTHLEHEAGRDVTRQEIFDLAGAFLFSGTDVDKPVRVLSGGERARLCLAGMLLARKPVLLLDEPTNHLDFETVEALGAALRDFAGTVVFISHDRTFVNMVATEIVEVDAGRVRNVAGSYADYVEMLQRRAREASGSGRPADRQKGVVDAAAMHAERRRRKNELARAEAAIKKSEARIAERTAERERLHLEMAKDPAGQRPETYARLAAIGREIGEAETAWIEASAKIEELREPA